MKGLTTIELRKQFIEIQKYHKETIHQNGQLLNELHLQNASLKTLIKTVEDHEKRIRLSEKAVFMAIGVFGFIQLFASIAPNLK